MFIDFDLVLSECESFRNVSSQTDAVRLVSWSLMEHFQRVLTGARFDGVEGTIDNALSGGLFAIDHDGIHEFGDNQITEFGIGVDDALFGCVTT
jgi:ABC-type anion transport system duplicated permease subunit